MAHPIDDLSQRARDIFASVVDAYLADGQPVGSRTIARQGAFNLSPASIRNVMQDLEEAGLLAAPHTSAGRIPTERGLRLFVDGMMQVAEPDRADRAQIERSVADGPVETALANATAALSGLSACAGLVMVPRSERVLKEVAFAPLSDGRAFLILVAADGSVENRVIDLPAGADPGVLMAAGRLLTEAVRGRTLAAAQAEATRALADRRSAIDAAAADLVVRGLAVWSEDASNRPVLIVRGQARLIDEAATRDLARVQTLLEELETQGQIAELLASAGAGAATRIFIGAETNLFALSGSSLVAAPFHGHDGRVVGVVGVIGPTRLNYARIVPMVDFTAQTLARLMR